MKLLFFIFSISLLVSCSTSLPSYWDDLKVTWGINIFTHFNPLPRTEQDAISKNWKLQSDCSKSNGRRYILNGDISIILIFRHDGLIAGISSAVPKNLPFNFPSSKVQEYMMDEGSFYTITAYFTDPSTVCSPSKTSGQVTGDRLVIVGKSKVLDIALNQSDVSSFWTKGKCFKTMGVHYWADLSGIPLTVDVDPDNFLPMFLQYNRGKLNGFGWAFNADFTSNRYEHPTATVLPMFFEHVPKFFTDPTKAGVLSTMHIYLDSAPQLNDC
jgi:hypothetical protein